MASDQLTHVVGDLSVVLSASGIRVALSESDARALDCHVEYVVEFHPESQDIASIGETLRVIFRGKLGLFLDT